jgi:hypothetical protein
MVDKVTTVPKSNVGAHIGRTLWQMSNVCASAIQSTTPFTGKLLRPYHEHSLRVTVDSCMPNVDRGHTVTAIRMPLD